MPTAGSAPSQKQQKQQLKQKQEKRPPTSSDHPTSSSISISSSTTTATTSNTSLRRTGVTEGFYRQNWQAKAATATATESSEHNNIAISPAPVSAPLSYYSPSPATTKTAATATSAAAAAAAARVLNAAGVNLKAPTELGLLPDAPPLTNNNNSSNNSALQHVATHPATRRLWQRQERSMRRSSLLSLFNNEKNRNNSNNNTADATDTETAPLSFVTSLCYKGMEVIFSTAIDTDTDKDNTSHHHHHVVYALCARTKLVFQKLSLLQEEEQEVVKTTATFTAHYPICMKSHAATGQVVIVMSNRRIFTFLPRPTNPKLVNFGRFHWHYGPMIECTSIFYPHVSSSSSSSTTSTAGLPLDISLAQDCKVLVAHGNQLAVFDASATCSRNSHNRSIYSNKGSSSSSSSSLQQANLLWTTALPGRQRVVLASISGDAHSIAVVLEKHKPYNNKEAAAAADYSSDDDENDDNNRNRSIVHGVYTFERDFLDGSTLSQSPIVPPSNHTHTTTTAVAVGILYKPGPFLVHSAPVTRLVFRGAGCNTSRLPKKSSKRRSGQQQGTGNNIESSGISGGVGGASSTDDMDNDLDDSATTSSRGGDSGNDLLLTVCQSDGSARIFGQSNWKLVTEWTLASPHTTRVDWVYGIAAMTLGDLEGRTSSSTINSKSGGGGGGGIFNKKQSSISNTSLSSLDDNAGNATIRAGGGGGGAFSDAAAAAARRPPLVQQQHFPTIPTHTTALSKAGAWICEITWNTHSSSNDGTRLPNINNNNNNNAETAPKDDQDNDAMAVTAGRNNNSSSSYTCPSIRLSRLTFLKRGVDDLSPTLFESVSSLLPPTTLFAERLLATSSSSSSTTTLSSNNNSIIRSSAAEDCLTVQGIWPTWDPFTTENSVGADTVANSAGTETLRGSAMAFLGLSNTGGQHASVPLGHLQQQQQQYQTGGNVGSGSGGGSSAGAGTGYYFGDAFLGGTQCPPTEVRIAAAHPISGLVVVLEFPLHGQDKSLVSLELGRPVRSVLNLSSSITPSTYTVSASTDHAAGRLIATLVPSPSQAGRSSTSSSSGNLISLTWQRPGTMSLMPFGWKRDDIDEHYDLAATAAAAAASFSTSSSSSQLYYSHHGDEESMSSQQQLQRLVDESLLPARLVLPPIRWSYKKRRRHVDCKVDQQVNKQEQIRLLLWWPEEDLGGPRFLLAATAAGTAVVFEIPPAVCSMYPVPRTKMSMEEWDAMLLQDAGAGDLDVSEATGTTGTRMEYEVNIIPDPDHGLGLRLECMEDGQPSIAGSFKKNPVTGDTLPAEKTGMISLGDELVSANGIILDEGQSFDSIISTVRELGASCGGNPIRMRFRRIMVGRSRLGSATSERSQRRSMEDILGLSPGGSLRKMMSTDTAGSQNSLRSGGSISGVLRPPLIAIDSPPVVAGGPSSQDDGDDLPRHGSIVGFFSSIEGLASALESNEPCNRIALVQAPPQRLAADEEYQEIDPPSAILLAIAGSLLHVSLLELVVDDDGIGGFGGPDQARTTVLGSFSIFEEDTDETCIAMQVVKSSSLTIQGSKFCVSLATSQNHVQLVLVSVDRRTLKASFTAFDVAKLQDPVLPFTIRAYSVDLIATMQSAGQTISVWSSRPHPGCALNTKNITSSTSSSNSSTNVDTNGSEQFLDYASSEIQVDTSMIGHNKFVDYCFVDSGFLDSSPTLIGFSLEAMTAYQQHGGNTDWLPVVQIYYSSLTGTNATIHENEKPQDRFPHLLSALRMVMSSYDERHFLRSDWHPDTLLAHICTDKRGAESALRHFARHLFLWLCGEGKDIPEDAARCHLLCGGLPIVWEEAPAQAEKDTTIDSVSGLMSALSMGTEVQKKSFYFDTIQVESMKKLQASLFNHLSPGGAGSFGQFDEAGDDMEIPAVLQSMRREDIHILWAIGQVLLEPPNFKSLDVCGQLFMFATSLFHKMKIDLKSEKENQPSRFTTFSFARKLQPSPSISETNDPAIASAACLSALLSGTQGMLMERLRVPGIKMDWPMLKELRAPFWMRSDKSLARLAEEIGQTIFREKRDVMECAIFFIISGKMRTLKNLAATDSTESGKKFFKFLTGFDFSSERGRRAAEKNAFSLLRKCRYTVASAFFLLAEPPLLQSALETIAGKSEDLDLAFLVGRLMESKEVPHGSGGSVLGFSSNGGGGGLFGPLGGGAGYAGTGAVDEAIGTPSDDIKFDRWTPCLGKATKKLLVERLIPMASGDNALSSTLLLWANKKEESAWWLPGFIESSFGSESGYRVVDDAEQRFFARLKEVKGHASMSKARSVTLAFQKANALIDFVSIPLMLDSMKASPRARDAASLLVSAALVARGVEVPPLLSCLLHDDDVDDARSDVTTTISGDIPGNVQVASLGKMEEPQSSIFAGFDPPPKPTSNGMLASSSIFDSFDGPPPRPIKTINQQGASSQGMQSSIFDSLNVPAAKPKTVEHPAVHADGMKSAIFDSFDAAPPPKPACLAAPSGEVQSSIFDSFETPKPPTRPAGEMQSSIFDSFEPPPRPKPSSTPSTPAATNSSIFDAFDTAPADKSIIPVEKEAADQSSHNVKTEIPEPEVLLSLQPRPTPQLWSDLNANTMELGVARRLLRELASILVYFHSDQSNQSVESFFSLPNLVPSVAAEILQIPCDSEQIVERVRACLDKLSTVSFVKQADMVDNAMRLLGGTFQPHRTLFAVVLYSAIERHDLAESALRSISEALIQYCNTFAFAYDDLVHRRATRSNVSSLYVRRQAAIMSWQLETCLWFHRGGGLPISGVALKEAVIAVRCGLLVASWNRNYESLEAMLRNDPDCLVDEQAGRHLWTSLRATSSPEKVDDKPRTTTTSGGWEFLVDCRRSEATVMLRESPTGTFIIRPHPSDHGVFTLSFKTNLVPTEESEGDTVTVEASAGDGDESRPQRSTAKKPVKKDDVVQHAIIRLSDSGFRCGSFGPFTSLLDLLEAVSASLPFKLRFDLPPTNRVIQEEGSQPSPNAVLFRKLALSHADSLTSNPPRAPPATSTDTATRSNAMRPRSRLSGPSGDIKSATLDRQKSFGIFLELLVLSKIRRQLSSIASVQYDSLDEEGQVDGPFVTERNIDEDSVEDSFPDDAMGGTNHFAIASWMMGPLLSWCRSLEIRTLVEVSPGLMQISKSVSQTSTSMKDASEQSIEMTLNEESVTSDGGDAALRRMIQRGSGVEFSTLRLVDGGECTMVVLFSRREALQWLLSSGLEQEEEDALHRLEQMENQRVIEPVDLSRLPLKQKSDGKNVGVRYRFVDPWEVEALSNRDGETKSASLGRERYVGFSFGRVALSCESTFRSLGGLPLLELWTSAKGGVLLTRALATIYPPWERAAGGDLQVLRGIVTEPDPFTNSIRQHLYRNALFRRLELPQRFVALVQVELLDLKNLSTPSGTVSLTVYALLRLKRRGSNAVLSNKTRTLDTALTQPLRLSKQSTVGPHAPASWGSVVRFRFPLPEGVSVEGESFDSDREVLFKGPPSVLQVSVYEKKLLVDHALGTADISADGLWAGGQLEEWVPLRSEKSSIHWFARIRLTLRYELMCTASSGDTKDLATVAPSVGLARIDALSRSGGVSHEDHKRSISSPDLLGYLESMVY